MPDELRLALTFVTAAATALLVTPFMIRIAGRQGFVDHPADHKDHSVPTAYLGGAAVLCGFVTSVLLFDSGSPELATLIVCAVGLGVVGAYDDRWMLAPRWRVLAEVAAAGAVTWAGLGFTFPASRFEELILNVVWIVAFTNAFNLMDNMNGAAAVVCVACSLGIAGQSIIEGAIEHAALALALAGGCAGFLRYNLVARRQLARIFLGDGGSMPIGFLLAVLAASVPVGSGLVGERVLVAGMLLGLLVLDTMLVIVSRSRRDVSLATGGQDHLTHRLRTKLGTAVRVAFVLFFAQLAVAAIAIGAAQVGRTTVIVAALACLALGAVAIWILDSPQWTAALPRGAVTEGRLAEAPAVRGDVGRAQFAKIEIDALEAGRDPG